MIVVDIETSGLFPEKSGIIQLAAYELETGKEFFESCRIEDDEEVFNKSIFLYGKQMKPTSEVTGLSEEDMRDPKKQSQKELLMHFFKFVEKCETRNVGCQNPQFDLGFIFIKARKYNVECPLSYRAFDLHSIAQLKYLQVNNKLKIENGGSEMDLSNILKFCGMKDERKEHNALEDTKLTAECFSRILYGKSIFKEYEKFKILEYLLK